MAQLLYLIGFLDHAPAPGRWGGFDVAVPHVTLVGPFGVADASLPGLRRGLQAAVAWLAPVPVVVGDAVRLGTLNEPVDAWLVHGEPPSALADLHRTLLGLVRDHGGSVERPEHAGDAYLPHVSHAPATGRALLDAVTLVHHCGGFGVDVEVLHTYPLGA